MEAPFPIFSLQISLSADWLALQKAMQTTQRRIDSHKDLPKSMLLSALARLPLAGCAGRPPLPHGRHPSEEKGGTKARQHALACITCFYFDAAELFSLNFIISLTFLSNQTCSRMAGVRRVAFRKACMPWFLAQQRTAATRHADSMK